MNAVGEAIQRLLCHGHEHHPVPSELEKDLRSKKVNYKGEEVGTCHKLTLAQILPALPPVGHGGSINAIDWVSEHSKHLLLNPQLSLLPDDGRPLPRLEGIVHAEKGEIDGIADELVKRGVCEWVPLDSVIRYRGSPVLNGLFGVMKGSSLEDGRPILRLIMNLVGSNSIMRQFTGAVKHLPNIATWMSIFVEEGEEVRMWQSDMSNAFYLFKVPDPWKKFLSFNVIRGFDVGEGDCHRAHALACCVLPMGWLSSVSIMREISEHLLQFGRLDPVAQLVRNKAVPQWMVGICREAKASSRLWWHVYLDNFALGQVVGNEEETVAGSRVHDLAEDAWKMAGVISSAKKRKMNVVAAQELGAFIDGVNHFIGGSPERLLHLIQATLWILNQNHLSKRLIQVIAGRWIHVMQFRRPSMAILDKVWEFTGKGNTSAGIQQAVRRELFQCLLVVPLLHAHFGSAISPVMTASDASGKGGAVGIAKSLSATGEAYVRACLATQEESAQVPVLVLSLFGGIGGSFRAYDILGLRPVGLVHFDTHKPANRVVSRRWPHAEIYHDVKDFTPQLFRDILARYLDIQQVHIWAGFPCTDLSSTNALGQGLAGPNSSLFYEVVRIKRTIQAEVGSHIVVKYVVENVASMKREECDTISEKLQREPYFLNPVDAVPMNRPRLCWTSEVLENVMEGITITQKTHWREITASAPYPELDQWVEPGVNWPGYEWGSTLPTAMKAIKRSKPPFRPAGIEKCDQDTLERYSADDFRYPPYQYQWKYIFFTSNGTWRTASAEEKELLLGYGWRHTALCYSASEIKQSRQAYDDQRHSLLGDSFSIFSFIIPAVGLCHEFLPRVSYKWLATRMGMAPGFRSNLRWQCPLGRKLIYGPEKWEQHVTAETLNRLLLSRTNHTGSDVRIASGEILNPKAHPRQSVEADWWNWEPSFSVKWKLPEHINLLELRSILLGVKFHVSHLGSTSKRVFHLTDSYISLSIASKGRTGSRQVARVLRKLNAFLLAHGITLVLGHVESTRNPTDGASRQVDLCF